MYSKKDLKYTAKIESNVHNCIMPKEAHGVDPV